ncbi:MAG: tetratricopeptide repeat protein, partial [Vicinamibacterales bacterium]
VVSKDSIVVGVAGVFFGLLVGWLIGSQQAPPAPQVPPQSSASAPASTAGGDGQGAPQLDESRAAALKTKASQNPSDAVTREQLGDLYFDAGRYEDAASWYEASLQIEPKNVSASTDLGISYYYMNQPDRALAQFDKSLAIDPGHAKTLLNIGIVRAFGKQDLKGAADAWQKVVAVAPSSDEAKAAQQALDGLRAAHPELGIAPPKGQGS